MGDRAGEGGAYGSLGNAYQSQGDFAKAIEYHTQDLAIAKEVGDRAGEGKAYGNLGIAYDAGPGDCKGGGGPGVRRVCANAGRGHADAHVQRLPCSEVAITCCASK